MRPTNYTTALGIAAWLAAAAPGAPAQIAVKAKKVYTMAPSGEGYAAPIDDGVVVIRDGKIASVGPAAGAAIPAGFRVIEGAVATPGLVDIRGTVGLTGIYNQRHDSDQIERSSPIQPELRAIDAYNPHEKLIEFVRSYGVTTVNTGHAPGELISGQSIVVKLRGNTVEEALVKDGATVLATFDPSAEKDESGKSPGTRAKMMAMLREELLKAQERLKKLETAPDDKKPDRSLRLEALGRVLKGEAALVITANRAQDIASCLRLREEFGFKLILDSGAEAYMVLDEIKAAGVPVALHPSMQRAVRDTENQSFETAAALQRAGIPFAIESGYESYVPKVRVILFEAAIAAANGLSFQEALAAVTISPARILGVADRVGSLEVGKDGDVALYDADPFEYTSHCIGVVIEGVVVSERVH